MWTTSPETSSDPSAAHEIQSVRVTAKADYAVRAAIELAAASPEGQGRARRPHPGIPLNFLENILGDLEHAGLVVAGAGPTAAIASAGRLLRSPWPT